MAGPAMQFLCINTRSGYMQSICKTLNQNLQPVPFLRENNGWLKSFGFFKIHRGIGNNDHNISFSALTGSRAIQTYYAASTPAFYNIGLYSFPVVYVHHLYLFMFN